MRQIIFRGKRVDNGEWVEGYLVVAYNPMVDENKSFIIENPAFYYGFSEFAIVTEVIPETVGQYTGLTDKNGKKIFEGDIIKGCWNTIFVVYYDEELCQFRGKVHEGLHRALDYCGFMDKIEVIGNIHDNGEILEEKK